MDDAVREALRAAESVLSLLHYRGLVDSEGNRRDVADALTRVQGVLFEAGSFRERP
jgi:hypothetical protein